MPLEIRELIIRTQIVSNEHYSAPNKYPQQEVDSKAIIEQCVKKILKILKKNKDR